MSDELIIAIIGAVGVIIGAFLAYFGVRRRNQADATKAITDSAIALLDPLKTRIGELEQRTAAIEEERRKDFRKFQFIFDKCMERVSYLMKGIDSLMHQSIARGEEPVFVPDEWTAPEIREAAAVYDKETG